MLGIAGCLIHYLKDWVAHNNEGKEYGLKKVIPAASLSLITTALLIYLRSDISQMYVITPFSAVVLGYLGNSVFFSFITAKKPKGLDEGIEVGGSKPGDEGRPEKP